MKIDSFEKLFHVLLCDIYYVENQLLESIPEMSRKAQSKELKDALNHHLEETRQQVTRLERIFKMINEEPVAVQWGFSLRHLFEEGKKLLEEHRPSPVLDACIIAIAQRIEHYEMATYGTLKEFANVLDLREIKQILDETLKEEIKADNALTKVAEGNFFRAGVNVKAATR